MFEIIEQYHNSIGRKFTITMVPGMVKITREAGWLDTFGSWLFGDKVIWSRLGIDIAFLHDAGGTVTATANGVTVTY
jgi:hypothetical protein